jgi:putative FmdB family regulatory protein
MPLYEYVCQDCGRRFEVLQRMGAGPGGVACPGCGGEKVSREASAFASRGGSCSPRGRFT